MELKSKRHKTIQNKNGVGLRDVSRLGLRAADMGSVRTWQLVGSSALRLGTIPNLSIYI